MHHLLLRNCNKHPTFNSVLTLLDFSKICNTFHWFIVFCFIVQFLPTLELTFNFTIFLTPVSASVLHVFFLLFYMNSSHDSLLKDAAITSFEDNSQCWFYEKGYSSCRSIRNNQSVQLGTEVENELQFWQSWGLSFLCLDQWQKRFTDKVSGFSECLFQRTVPPYRSYTGQLIM